VLCSELKNSCKKEVNMSVTILPPERTSWDVIGRAIGENLNRTLPQIMQQNAQRQQLQSAFNQIDPNKGMFEQMQSILPNILSIPGGAAALNAYQNAQQNEEKNKQLAGIFGNNSQNQPGAPEGGGQAKNVPDLTNVSDEALARLSIVDPQRANALRHIVQIQRKQKADKQKSDLEGISNTKFSEGYQAIQDDDTESLNDIMKDPKTPYEVKNRLSNLKNQHDVRKDVKSREIRTRQNFIQSAYSRAINNERNRLISAANKDKPEINDRIKDLIRAQRKDMKKFAEDPESYHRLGIWDNEASKYLPEDEFEEDEEGLGNVMGAEGQEYGMQPNQPQPGQGKKVRFNSQNPAHVARAKQVLAEVGGDKAKANAILFKEFEK
jgi:hypothetical protein